MNLIEYTRSKMVSDLFEMKSFNEPFSVWKNDIYQELGNEPRYHDIVRLGDSLSEIFFQTNTDDMDRDNSAVSSAGHAWEALICWYLNYCLVGTKSVVVKHKKDFVPKPIADAITVQYGSFKSNSEADLIGMIFPETDSLSKEVNPDENTFDLRKKLDSLCRENFEQMEVGIIQCKTNWKDNSQIPMLWDMVYSSKGFDNNITLGAEEYTLKSLKDFFYAFVTVPTNDDDFKADSTAVNRVKYLSGGNYWGKESKSGVARSIKEIFKGNFDFSWKGSTHRSTVNNYLDGHPDLSYFRLN